MQKTLKSVSLAVLATLVSVALALSVFASAAFAEGTYVKDRKQALSSSEAAALESKAASISQASGVGVYLYYIADLGTYASARECAKAIYQKEGLGLGSGHDGIMFLVAVDSRDYVTITYGKGVNAFTDNYIGVLEDDVTSYLHDDDWNGAGEAYLNRCNTALTYYTQNGEPYEEPTSPLMAIIAGIVAALFGGGAVAGAQRAKMKSAVEATEADNYLDAGTFDLQDASDDFRTTVVVCIQTHEQKEAASRSTVDSGGFGGSSGGKF
ncbi:MAG: TPM domain-containing protein [Coriobacteriia bacterium]|nr:TPM domain-containing protein [Coriobacteriia bacterium]